MVTLLQQPTIAQVLAAPNPEIAAQKGVSHGGLVIVSDKAKVVAPSSTLFSVVQTARPVGVTASASATLTVTVPEAEKLNPASYTEFRVREPGRPEFRVPVLLRHFSAPL